MAGHVSATKHATFTLERNFAHPVSRVFGLLSDPDKKRRWLIDDAGTTVKRFDMDFRVGGHEVGEYFIKKGSPVDGMPFVNDSVFFDIVPDQRVIMGQTMSIAGGRISVALITFALAATDSGTQLTITHQGTFLEGADGPEMREGGWKALMNKIAAAADEIAP